MTDRYDPFSKFEQQTESALPADAPPTSLAFRLQHRLMLADGASLPPVCVYSGKPCERRQTVVVVGGKVDVWETIAMHAAFGGIFARLHAARQEKKLPRIHIDAAVSPKFRNRMVQLSVAAAAFLVIGLATAFATNLGLPVPDGVNPLTLAVVPFLLALVCGALAGKCVPELEAIDRKGDWWMVGSANPGLLAQLPVWPGRAEAEEALRTGVAPRPPSTA